MSWTDSKIATLKKLCAQGKSAGEIAAILSREGSPVSRNAVMGKIHRLHIKLSSTAIKQKPQKTKAKQVVIKSSPQISPKTTTGNKVSAKNSKTAKSTPANDVLPSQSTKVVVAVKGSTTIMTLTDRMCKWPESDPRLPDFRFCGRPADPGKPYCQEHAAIAYQPARRRDDERKVRFRIGQRQ